MVKLTDTAETVLKDRKYYQEGEDWRSLSLRVATQFGKSDEEIDSFYDCLLNCDFIPNSPALMNAGTDIHSYSACFVLPIEDSMESIFKYYSDAGLISKSGGGVGATFTHLRAKDSKVGSTSGVSSGPISFMRGQDALTEVVKQGGKRKGANMGILNCDHPDIWDFISVKDTPGILENFNLSVGITDEFMETVTDNEDYGIYDSVNRDIQLFDEICKRAWSSGEPGVIFLDTAEAGNVVPHLGKLEACNPCGEQFLLPYENCCLGSINLSNMLWEYEYEDGLYINWSYLQSTVHTATLLLNRILDASELPIPECQEAMNRTRKIGLGIMGLHDMLIQLGIPYDSGEGRTMAAEVMKFIADEADNASCKLGREEGFYTACDPLTGDMGPVRRNANLTTIAPTGTLSTIADCSSGCEPYYAPSYTRENIGKTFTMYNKWVTTFATEEGITEDEVLKKYPELFKGAEDIHWRDHILMQAALQPYVDSSISKTINMPNDATVEDVKEAYKLAWEKGCKGITIYRDGSRQSQVLTTSGRDAEGSNGGLVDEDQSTTAPCVKAALPDALKATRYRVKVDDQKVYIIICETDEGRPVEIFSKFPYGRDSNWTSLCRSLSLSLRYGIPLVDIVKQLEKSVKQINDTPSHLARILKTYMSEKGQGIAEECPDCGAALIFTEGCEKCQQCAWSKCG